MTDRTEITPRQRPWAALYREGYPEHREVPFANALEMWRARAAAPVERTAVHYFDTTLSHQRIDELSDAVGAALQDRGVAPGDRVAVFLQNVPQFLVALIATWKAGAILVPVNPMLKGRELAKQLDNVSAGTLICLESYYDSLAEAIGGTSVRTVITTSELDFLTGPLPEPLADSRRQRHEGVDDLLELADEFAGRAASEPPLSGEEVAVLVHTSGSTGAPKAVMTTHANYVYNSLGYRDWFELGEGDCCLGASPLMHITGLVGHIGASLAAPVPLVLGFRFEPATFMELIERYRATFTVVPPTALISMMEHPDSRSRDLSSMNKLCSGMVEQALADWEARFDTRITQIYGSTECTSPCHGVPLRGRAPRDPDSGRRSIGIPMAGTVPAIVDDEGNELPAGERGELVIRGPQVAAGYWGQPDAEAFADGAYHTGDVAYMAPEGWFHIVGRIKDMISVSGFKVSSAEVEGVLYEHPGIREAAVIGVPDEYRGETVKAYVTLTDDALTETEIIEFCRERMAAYKYPRSVVIVADLPKTESGKILKTDLPG